MSYYRSLRVATDANMEVAKEDPWFQRGFFHKLFTNKYLIRGEMHRTRALEFEILQRTAVCSPIFEKWHNSKILLFLQEIFTCTTYQCTSLRVMGRLPAFYVCRIPSMFAHYSCAFGGSAKRFGNLLLETAMTKFTVMYFVYFIQATEYGKANLFLPARLWALTENGCYHANEEIFAPLSCKMRVDILKRGLLRMISACATESVVAIIAFARAGEIDRTAADCFDWFLYDFAGATTVFVP